MEEKEKLKRLEECRKKRKEDLTKKVEALGGLWLTPDSVEAKMAAISAKGKRLEAVKAQIFFSKDILGQKLPQDVATFSKDGVKFSAENLMDSLKLIITGPAFAPEADGFAEGGEDADAGHSTV